MYIVPISSQIARIDSIKPISSGAGIAQTSGETSVAGFKDVLQSVVGNVEQAEAATRQDAYDLATGNMDDMHTMMINAAKADLALQTMVQLRNKMLEAYQEVMRINL